MEQRKIQLSGRTTFVVSLPKKWITTSRLEVGDPVGIELRDDGSLTVVPVADKKTPERGLRIDVGAMPAAHLMRVLLAAYQSGFGHIELATGDRFTPAQKSAVREVLARTAGLEIVEERPTEMVLADLVDPRQYASRQGIQRLRHIVTGMVRDALTALQMRDADLALDVQDRDDSVDRIYLMISKQHVQLLSDLTLARSKKITIRESLFLMLVARALERCGDHAVRIAVTLEESLGPERKVRRSSWDLLEALAEESLDLLSTGVDAFLRADADKAHEVIERSDAITADRRALTQEILAGGADELLALGLVVESLERLHQYASDIAEIALAQVHVKADQADGPGSRPRRMAGAKSDAARRTP